MKISMVPSAAHALSAVLLLSALGPWAEAAEPGAVGVVTTLQGRASVAHAARPEPVRLSFKDDVFPRDRISTGEGALVRVLLGGHAVVTVRELSVLTISEQAGRAVVALQSGAVAASVANERMRPGESIEIRTPNAIAAVRGTVLVVEAGEAPGAAGLPFSRIHVIRGQVEVSAPGGPGAQPALVGAHQQISVTGRVLGAVEAAPAHVLDRGQTVHQHDAPPDDFVEALAERENGRALGLAHSILRAHHGGGSDRHGGQGRGDRERDSGPGHKDDDTSAGGGDAPLRGDKALATLGRPDADGSAGGGRGQGGGVPRAALTATSRGHHGHH